MHRPFLLSRRGGHPFILSRMSAGNAPFGIHGPCICSGPKCPCTHLKKPLEALEVLLGAQGRIQIESYVYKLNL